jgi:hypothetical protein
VITLLGYLVDECFSEYSDWEQSCNLHFHDIQPGYRLKLDMLYLRRIIQYSRSTI